MPVCALRQEERRDAGCIAYYPPPTVLSCSSCSSSRVARVLEWQTAAKCTQTGLRCHGSSLHALTAPVLATVTPDGRVVVLTQYTVWQPRQQWKVTTWFGPSPVTRARDYQTMEGRQSSVTSRCLVALFWHCLSDQTPPGMATPPASPTAVAFSPPWQWPCCCVYTASYRGQFTQGKALLHHGEGKQRGRWLEEAKCIGENPSWTLPWRKTSLAS